MTILHIDFETFSECDLKARGLGNYATHPSTLVHCMAFAFDDEPVEIFIPKPGEWQDCEVRIADHVEAEGLVYAHNAAFELAVWNNIMARDWAWPILKPEQCRCTMAMAYAMALPGALEDAAPALGIELRKDNLGKRTMLLLCKPKKDGTRYTPEANPMEFFRLYAYCKQDVEVERALHKRMMELSPAEQELWNLDYKINQHGILVDLPSIGKAIKLVGAEKIRLDREMLKATGGVVGSCSEVQLMVKWIRSQGVELGGVAKSDVIDALALDDVPPAVRRALLIRQEAAKSSTAKLVAMQDRANTDGRVRGSHQYHGASTGRWAGRGVQVQNLSRPRADSKPKDIEDIIDHLDDRDYIDMCYGPVLDALSDSLRGMIVAPPGKDLIAMDFSAIEARVLAWLAGEEKVLEVFRTTGKIYEHAAAGIYRVPVTEVTKEQRQIGKVAILALGYGGSVGAFASMAKNYGVELPKTEVKAIVRNWREANSEITAYWKQLEWAAMESLKETPAFLVGPKGRQVAFLKKGSFLWCKLPSGRVLCYPYPQIRTVTVAPEGYDPWEAEAITFMSMVDPARKLKILDDPNSSGKWQRISTYGGSLAENLTQAVARDLLAEAMKRLDAQGYEISMHVHDEVVIEVDSSAPEDTLKTVERIMSEVPAWATGLPVSAEGWRAKRYRK